MKPYGGDSLKLALTIMLLFAVAVATRRPRPPARIAARSKSKRTQQEKREQLPNPQTKKGPTRKAQNDTSRRKRKAVAEDSSVKEINHEDVIQVLPSEQSNPSPKQTDLPGVNKVQSPKRRTRRARLPATRRPFATYLDEIARGEFLEHREVTALATEIRTGVRVEEAKRTLTQSLGRRPALPEIADYLQTSPQQVQTQLMRGTAAKNRLVSANLRLVTSIAKQVASSKASSTPGVAFDDMIQEGSVGLIRAAEKYDASRGYKFSTYATWWIRACVLRAITTQSRAIKVPSTVVDEYARIRKEYLRQTQAGQFEPSEQDVACALGITPAKLRFVVQVATRSPASLDLSIGSSSDAGTRTLGEVVEGDDHIEERMVADMQKRELDKVLREALRPLERAIVRLRFGLDDGHPRTLKEIGVMLKLSRERVRQLLYRALTKLNTPQMRQTLTDYLF